MIPPRELERLVVAAVTAAALGQSGQTRLGYDWLHAGYLQALDDRGAGRNGSEKLIQRWRQVMDAYCAEFDLAPAGCEPQAACA
jgi:hypothetical protein